MFFSVIDRATSRVKGRKSLMDIVPAIGPSRRATQPEHLATCHSRTLDVTRTSNQAQRP